MRVVEMRLVRGRFEGNDNGGATMQRPMLRTHAQRGSRGPRSADESGTKRAAANPRSRKRERKAEQGELEFRSWGGARRGAGRKPKGERALVPHISRPMHKARFPVLITTRLRPGLPSLRRSAEAARIRAALASSSQEIRHQMEAGEQQRSVGAARGVARFQVVHHSIQSNHLHLIVEAEDRAAMTTGVRSLLVRIARALNRLWQRAGAVFADRFHERTLLNPRQVRNALVYVLQNLRKHGICMEGPDPFSSGPEFDGWRPAGLSIRDSERAGRAQRAGAAFACAPLTLLRAERGGIPSPKTWLLDVGWRRHGLIDPYECPRVH